MKLQIDYELLDFQTYLDIDEKVEELMDENNNDPNIDIKLGRLMDLKEDYEDNFTLFFKLLNKDPKFASEAHNKLIELIDKGEPASDNERYIASYNPLDVVWEDNDIRGKCWRYEAGMIVTVGPDIISTEHPFNEGDRIEIISLEGGEHVYQYYAKFVEGANQGWLINDEELE